MDRPVVNSDLQYDPCTGQFKWLVLRGRRKPSAGHLCKESGYLLIGWCGKVYRAHRLAWFFVYGTWPDLLDHINRNRADNRLANLRIASKAQNSRNAAQRSSNKSGVTGVSYDAARGKWRASLVVDGRQVLAQRFDSVEDAKAAYKFAVQSRGLHYE